MSNWSQSIKDHIAKSKIANALAEFIAHNQDVETENTLILLSGRWNSLRKKERMGVLAQNDIQTETNRITYALLEILSEREAIEKTQPAPGPTDDTQNAIQVQGNGNIIIQGVTGSTINIQR